MPASPVSGRFVSANLKENDMIEAINIHKHYGVEAVLSGADVRIVPGEKVGMVGRNGAGKTTLVRILTGEDGDYSGTVRRGVHETLACVPQHFPVRELTAIEFMVEPVAEQRRALAALEEEMAGVEGRELERVLEAYGDLRTSYDAGPGDEAESRALGYLESLGLADSAETPLAALSGGERNILALGRALLSRPDVLVLDEPGNHLDMWGLAWLEQFVREYPGAVIVISHNRYLLDRICSRIIEIDGGKTRSFTGNYSAYRIEKLRSAVSGEMAFRADEKKIEQLEAVVKKFADIARRTADPAWGRRLRARRTHLEKTKEAAREKPKNPVESFSVSFETDASRANLALKVGGLSCAFGERVLFSNVSLTIHTGERVALVGANGSGKSTFLREVLRLHEAQDPSVFVGPSMTVAYCSQHAEGLDRTATILDVCIDAGAKTLEDARKALAPFLFPREALEQKIGSLSGGELNRLQLALAGIRKANFLILDEPTNHLDIPACEAIEEALLDFAGTILVVSHDRYFLDRIATRVLEIDSGTITSWDGNFSEFWFERYGTDVSRPIRTAGGGRQNRGGDARGVKAHSGGVKAGGVKAGGTQAAGASFVEQRIINLEAEQRELESRMAAAYSEGDLARARTLGTKLDRTRREVERLYAAWE